MRDIHFLPEMTFLGDTLAKLPPPALTSIAARERPDAAGSARPGLCGPEALGGALD